MRSLALVPAALTLFLATAAILLAGTAQAVQWLPWFRRGSADLRADRLLLAVLCPLLASGAITLFVMATLVDDLLAFHQMPHLCLDPSALSATGRFAVFAMEGGTLLALAAMGCQMVRAIWLLRQYGRAVAGQQLGLSDRAAAAVARVREHLECTAEFHEADLPRPTAFVLGARRPRCIIARSLVERLSPEELGAAIAHEAAHLHRGDHIAQLLIFTCGRLFGFLPPVRALLSAWEEAAELAADDLAVERTGCRLELAAALLAAARWASQPGPTLAGGSAAFLARRVERLLAPAPAMPTSARQRYLTVLIAGGLASGIVQVVAHSPLLPSLHCLVESLALLAWPAM